MTTLSLMVSLLDILCLLVTRPFATSVRMIPEADKLNIESPRPVVLDSHLRLHTNCKLLKNYRDGKGQQPWVFCILDPESTCTGRDERKSALEAAGAVVHDIPSASGTTFCIP